MKTGQRYPAVARAMDAERALVREMVIAEEATMEPVHAAGEADQHGCGK